MAETNATNARASAGSSKWALPYLLLISGFGGLLAGVDFGIIAGALAYLDKTIELSAAQLSFVVAVYTIGGFASALLAGIFADWIGRKKMMIAGGLMFVVSILLIYTSAGYAPLLCGRFLMGLSGGVLCVVVPLYMAECLPSAVRGRGTSIFQFMLTLGIVSAAAIGAYFTRLHDAAVTAANGDPAAIFAADGAAWRRMFLVAIVPGLFYTIGAFLLRESPRWLFRRGRTAEAESILRLSRGEEQTRLEISEMGQGAAAQSAGGSGPASAGSIFQRKYIVPFAIACIVLACTQATGINSIFAYAVVIFKGAGLDNQGATTCNLVITILNCAVTLVGAALVDRLGRKALLTIGTGGIIVSLASAGFVYRQFEAQRVDVASRMAAGISQDGRELSVKVDEATLGALPGGKAGQLSVLFQYDDGQGYHRQAVVSAFSNAKEEKDRTLTIKPQVDEKWKTQADGTKAIEKIEKDKGKLTVLQAKYGPVPSPSTGWIITALLCLFIASFSVGPGVCVWLALTELMPTRIRSTGMGIAMMLNTGVQFLIQLFFLPVVGSHGFHVMFFFWAGCTVVYFITAAFFMPETKGKTLEEIEAHFAGKARAKA